jgi:membrane-bound lytic murein transglycosylase MltF
MTLVLVPEALEDEDMMDMLAAGLLKAIVFDDWKAEIWAGLLPKIKPRPDLALADAGATGWAFRKGSPKLAEVVNEFIRRHPDRTRRGSRAIPRT